MHVRIDHVVIWVDDPLRSLEFYERVVGLTAERTQEFRAGKVPFPSVRVSEDSIIDLMPRVRAGETNSTLGDGTAGHPVNHVCLAMSQADFEALRQRLHANGSKIPMTMTQSFGAKGLAPETFYFLDPDKNVIEARYYS